MNAFLYRLLRLSRFVTAISKGRTGPYARRAAKSWITAKASAGWRR